MQKNLDEVQTRQQAVAAAARQPLDAETKTGAQVALHYITLAARLAALLPIIKTMCHPLTQLAGQKQMDSHTAAVFHVWHGHRPWELTGRWRKTIHMAVCIYMSCSPTSSIYIVFAFQGFDSQVGG